VISTAAAAPAFAAFSDTLSFSGSASWNGGSELNVVFSVANNSTTEAAQTLEVNLSYSPVASVSLPPAGAGAWTLVAGSPAGSVKLICPSVDAFTPSSFTLRFTYGSSGNRTVGITGTVKTTSAFEPQVVDLSPAISSSNK